MILSFSLSELTPYINWPYFFFAWQVKDPSEKSRLRQEAESLLSTLEGKYHASALFELFNAYSSGDDIVVSVNQGDRSFDSSRQTKSMTCPPDLTIIPCLRQQQGTPPYLCLSDFLAPDGNFPLELCSLATEGTQESSIFRSAEGRLLPKGRKNIQSTIGLFATSVSPSLETDFSSDPYLKLMTQLLADRLAEAAAERMHEQVRKDFWGYAKDENLSIPDMLVEKFQGIRPAVGYPSLPDTSLNFIIDDLIDMKQIGIRLTESGAMKPHASVSGLMLAHPEARYFSVGKIGEDQLRDYASRRGLPLELIRRFLASNL